MIDFQSSKSIGAIIDGYPRRFKFTIVQVSWMLLSFYDYKLKVLIVSKLLKYEEFMIDLKIFA